LGLARRLLTPYLRSSAFAVRLCAAATDPKETVTMTAIDPKTEVELEAAAYRKLVEYLRKRSDVQNIDLMNLAGFCRNCLANWYQDAAREKGIALEKDAAREIVYGMPYKEWQARNQTEASAETLAAFEVNRPKEH